MMMKKLISLMLIAGALPAATFAGPNLVVGPDFVGQDTTPPTIDLNTFKISSASVHAGETLEVTVHASDSESGLFSEPSFQNGYLNIIDPEGKCVDLSGWGHYDKATDLIVFKLSLNPYTLPGVYHVVGIKEVRDKAGNFSEYQDIADQNLKFNVINENPDITPPVVDIESFKLSAKSVQAGDAIEVTVHATDENSGLVGDDGSSWNQNGYLTILDPQGKSVDLAGWGNYNKNTDLISFTLRLNRYAVPGTYQIVAIKWVRDNAGNFTETQDVSDKNLKFIVENSNPDTQAPTVDLNSFQLSRKSIQAGSEMTITVLAYDKESGLRGDGTDTSFGNQNGYLRYVDPNGRSVDLSAWGHYEDMGRIVFIARMNPYAPRGTYRITGIKGITDNAGNTTDHQDLIDQNLTFEVTD